MQGPLSYYKERLFVSFAWMSGYWVENWKKNVSLHAYIDPLANKFVDFYTDLILFLSNINYQNPAYSVITRDFNARSPLWWDLDKENNTGHEIGFVPSSAVYSQLIDQATHTTKESSSCIDIIFTSNPNFVRPSGVELSIYVKCYHDLIYWKINFNVPFLPTYIREVWDYKNAQLENI